MSEVPEGGVTINGVVPGAGMCVVKHCGKRTAEGYLMCPWCWSQVPSDARQLLAIELQDWQDGRATLGDLREAQWACLEAMT